MAKKDQFVGQKRNFILINEGTTKGNVKKPGKGTGQLQAAPPPAPKPKVEK